MKVRPSVKKICDKCKIIKRNGKLGLYVKPFQTKLITQIW